jgi:hypothetical protein
MGTLAESGRHRPHCWQLCACGLSSQQSPSFWAKLRPEIGPPLGTSGPHVRTINCGTEPFAAVPNPSQSKSENHCVQSLPTQSAFAVHGEPFGERQLPF